MTYQVTLKQIIFIRIAKKVAIKSIQATGRGSGALTRKVFWPAPDFCPYKIADHEEGYDK